MHTRVVLVDDHAEFRHLMRALLGRQADLEVVAQAGSLAEARSHAVAVRCDVAVLDLGLPDGNGADLIADLREANPDVAVLVLSASLDPPRPTNLRRATEAGADEIQDKRADPAEVVSSVRHLGNRCAEARPHVRINSVFQTNCWHTTLVERGSTLCRLPLAPVTHLLPVSESEP